MGSKTLSKRGKKTISNFIQNGQKYNINRRQSVKNLL